MWQALPGIVQLRTNPVCLINSSHLLTGLVRYGHCGGKMHGQVQRKKGGREYQYYICTNAMRKGNCKYYRIRAELLERHLTDLVQTILSSPDIRTRVCKEIESRLKRQKPSPNQIERLRKAIGKIEEIIRRGTEALLLAAPADVADA